MQIAQTIRKCFKDRIGSDKPVSRSNLEKTSGSKDSDPLPIKDKVVQPPISIPPPKDVEAPESLEHKSGEEEHREEALRDKSSIPDPSKKPNKAVLEHKSDKEKSPKAASPVTASVPIPSDKPNKPVLDSKSDKDKPNGIVVQKADIKEKQIRFDDDMQKTLLRAVQLCSRAPFFRSKLIDIMLAADRFIVTGDRIEKISCKTYDITRSVLKDNQGLCLLLMTRVKKMNDIRIGKGGFKTVKFVVDLYTAERKVVAICKGPKYTRSKARLITEAEFMLRLQGAEGVVQLESSYFTKDKCYLIMEYCDRGDLYKALEGNLLTLDDKVGIAKDILSGINHIHKAGIIHRDLKPLNVLLYTKPDGKVGAKISDFGLACDTGDKEARKDRLGTSSYIAPERCVAMKNRDKESMAELTNEASDIWVIGCILFYLFTPDNKFLDHMELSTQNNKAWSQNPKTLAGAAPHSGRS